MNASRPIQIILLLLILSLVACNDPAKAPGSHAGSAHQSLTTGYGILKTTLGDEQHLKTIRLTKALISFKPVSEPTREIIDDIAQTSAAALEELEQLVSLSPEITFETGEDEQIEQKTRNALRITTAKEFVTSKENFEVILLISQTQALRFISHLSKELNNIETNSKRKVWLRTISDKFENLYLRTLSRLKTA